MHLANILLTQVADGLAPVEHRRQLDDDAVGFRCQQRHERYHVGGAVADAVSAAAVTVAAGRVDINKVNGRHLPQVVLAVGTDNLGLPQS